MTENEYSLVWLLILSTIGLVFKSGLNMCLRIDTKVRTSALASALRHSSCKEARWNPASTARSKVLFRPGVKRHSSYPLTSPRSIHRASLFDKGVLVEGSTLEFICTPWAFPHLPKSEQEQEQAGNTNRIHKIKPAGCMAEKRNVWSMREL